MSAIQAAVLEACDIDKPGKNRQAFLHDAAKAISGLADKAWNGLPKEVQKWFNDAADVVDANKAKGKSDPLPEFPDYEEPREESSTRRRRGGEEESPIKVGMKVTVIKKNGRELTGELVERNAEVVVLLVDGKEREIEMDDVGSIESVNDGKGKDSEVEIGVGTVVKLVTKRGGEFEGEIVKLTEDKVVIKTKDGDEDFSRTRVESMTPIGAGKKKEEETSTRRRSSEGDTKGSDKKKDDETERKRSSNAPGVSIGQRIRELIIDNMGATKDEIGKLLKKEDVDFRDNTLDLNYNEAHKFLKLLKERKLLKG